MATSARSQNLWQQRATMALADAMPKDGPPALSERQEHLQRRWRWYCANQYEHRAYNFDGTRRLGPAMREQVARDGMAFPSDLEGQKSIESLPWRYRHPLSPYHLARTITRRFTGLLFGADKHPTIECADDVSTSEFAQGLAEAARLWPRMAEARNYGGAMGAAAVIFRFSRGRPAVSVLDPCWCTPTYRDRATKDLASLEHKYYFPKFSADGRTTWWWYRRVINEHSDVVFEEKNVADPTQWRVKEQVDHGLGFFPGVWIQNSHVEEEDEGEPDCIGIYDTLEEMDELMSAAAVGTKSSCDPTVVLSTDRTFDEVKKGSKWALRLGKGEGASYMESTGSGSVQAREHALLLRRFALEVAQCVIEEPESGSDRTATEVDSRRQSMWDRGAELREQYGEMGAKPLIEKMIMAARMFGSGSLRAGDGRILKMTVQVPAMVDRDPATGAMSRRDRQPGAGTSLAMVWPPFVRPTPAQALAAAQAVASARNTSPPSIDQTTATTFLVPYFGGQDPEEVRARAVAEHQADQEAGSQQLLDGMGATPPPGAGAPGGAVITLDEFEAGAFTIDEYRASRGFGPLPDGAGEQTIVRKKAPLATPIGGAPPTDQPAAVAAPAAPEVAPPG